MTLPIAQSCLDNLSGPCPHAGPNRGEGDRGRLDEGRPKIGILIDEGNVGPRRQRSIRDEISEYSEPLSLDRSRQRRADELFGDCDSVLARQCTHRLPAVIGEYTVLRSPGERHPVSKIQLHRLSATIANPVRYLPNCRLEVLV